jgi:hypothetical protein
MKLRVKADKTLAKVIAFPGSSKESNLSCYDMASIEHSSQILSH